MFDFETVPERRGGDSYKWARYRDPNVIAMWLADMDFASPPAVVEALCRRAGEGLYGYARATEGVTAAVLAHAARAYGWQLQPEWLVWLPGLVPGLALAARAGCAAGEAVLTVSPNYGHFFGAVRSQERQLQVVPMRRAGPAWEFDWAALEAAVTPQTRGFMFCNPHNPLGCVHPPATLARLGDFCRRHRLWLCSDEIHCDLLLDGRRHCPSALAAPDLAERCITLMAPSKTYNLPGLSCGFAIIPDDRLRRGFLQARQEIVPEVNLFGYVACEAAYRHGEPWRQELLACLARRRDRLEAFVAEELAPVSMTHVEAGYLAWLDLRALGGAAALARCEAAGVGLADGAGHGGPGFARMTFACPGTVFEEALRRLRTALGPAGR